ncbi:hypothetical protein KEM60_00385 [Austwickia sp. TVS 96-490-7B]|nr:hypothetical protein [Austwickia sp. TVS 96-490-7B]
MFAISGASCNWGRQATPAQTLPGTDLVGKAQAGCVKFRYDNNGAELARVYPGGVIQSRHMDASGRIDAISSQLNNAGPLLTSQGYSFNNGGDKTNVQSWSTGAATSSPGPASGASQTFTYDSLNRLTKVVETGGSAASWTYGYDQMGNRTSLARTGATGLAAGNETAAYDAASMLTSNSYGAFGYDRNGNETTAPAGPNGTGIPARTGQVTDPVGNTTAMTVAGSGLSFGYGGTSPGMYNQLLSAHGSRYGRSILGLALSSHTTGGTTIRYLIHPNGSNIGYAAPEGQAWFLTDRLGTIIGLANDTGALIASYSYDPTGLPRATTETGTLAGYNIHRYAGGILDKTTGLTRFGVRWYNPATGRFTTPDPSGKEKNKYLYASGNTCAKTDITGEGCGEDFLFGAISLVGLAASTVGLVASTVAEVPSGGLATAGLWASVIGYEASWAGLAGSLYSIKNDCG